MIAAKPKVLTRVRTPFSKRMIAVNNTKRTTCFNTTAKHQVSNLIEVKLTQAVLNQKTGKLTTNYQLLGDYPQNYQFSFGLHFFVKSGEDFRYLATEKMSVFPQNNLAENLNPYAISSYSWLDNLNKKDNLYIIVDNNPFTSINNIQNPIFDENLAVPVLLMK